MNDLVKAGAQVLKKEHVELRRRPLLTPVWLTVWAGLAVIALLAWFIASLGTTTVVVVRHAEKELGTIEDAPLSQAGEQRAEMLSRMFGERDAPGRIEVIFATDTRRSQRTAAPLAERLGIEVTTVDANDVEGLVHRIRNSSRGRRVLVVGHSNTVPEIVSALTGGVRVPAIAESDYSAIYVVTLPTLGPASVLRLSY